MPCGPVSRRSSGPVVPCGPSPTGWCTAGSRRPRRARPRDRHPAAPDHRGVDVPGRARDAPVRRARAPLAATGTRALAPAPRLGRLRGAARPGLGAGRPHGHRPHPRHPPRLRRPRDVRDQPARRRRRPGAGDEASRVAVLASSPTGYAGHAAAAVSGPARGRRAGARGGPGQRARRRRRPGRRRGARRHGRRGVPLRRARPARRPAGAADRLDAPATTTEGPR